MMCGSHSSRSSIVAVPVEVLEREPLHALRGEVTVGHRVPHRDDGLARPFSAPATALVVWLLPTPVRTAVTATVGIVARSIVASGPRSTKFASAASTSPPCASWSRRDVGIAEHHVADVEVADHPHEFDSS